MCAVKEYKKVLVSFDFLGLSNPEGVILTISSGIDRQ